MQEHSQEFQDLLKNVETALIKAGQNARRLAEQTGTKLIIKERAASAKLPHDAEKRTASEQTVSARSYP